jgi:hypothetical protein
MRRIDVVYLRTKDSRVVARYPVYVTTAIGARFHTWSREQTGRVLKLDL